MKVASRVALPRMPSEVPPMMDVPKKEFTRRRPRIEGKDVVKYGPTRNVLDAGHSTEGKERRTTQRHAGQYWKGA